MVQTNKYIEFLKDYRLGEYGHKEKIEELLNDEGVEARDLDWTNKKDRDIIKKMYRLKGKD